MDENSPQKPSMTSTRLLYQEQGNLYSHVAQVTSIHPLEPDQAPDTHALYLDETIFHVQGGGQPSDTGIITIKADGMSANGALEQQQPVESRSLPDESAPVSNDENNEEVKFEVTSVRYAENNTIRHNGHFTNPNAEALPPQVPPPLLPATLNISIPRRHLNSRLHTAGHVLGVAIMSLTPAEALPPQSTTSTSSTIPHPFLPRTTPPLLPPLHENKASHHPGTSAVEFQGFIEGRYKDAIQKAADRIVAEARAVTIHFWNRAECVEHGVEVPDDDDDSNNRDGEGTGTGSGGRIEKRETYRVVMIEGYGGYPCGGTHVEDTKGVGRVVVKKISRAKGGSRVSYSVE